MKTTAIVAVALTAVAILANIAAGTLVLSSRSRSEQ